MFLCMQHIPGFMKWLKYISFVYYGFRLLLKMQYSPSQLYDCAERGGCVSIQESPSFQWISLNGGAREAWVLIVMAIGYRVLAYVFLRRRIKLETWQCDPLERWHFSSTFYNGHLSRQVLLSMAIKISHFLKSFSFCLFFLISKKGILFWRNQESEYLLTLYQLEELTLMMEIQYNA